MKLYYDPITVNCRKVLAGLDMIGAKYEDKTVDYFGGGHKLPAYAEINPNEQLPALIDEDLVLWESNAILVYACEKLGNKAMYPADARTRGDITRWLLWESGTWFGSCYVYLVENVVKPLLDDKPDAAILKNHEPTFLAHATILNNALKGRDWICADHATIADIALAAPMHLHAAQKLPLENFPNIRNWMTRVEALPAWQNSDPIPHIPAELLAKLA